MTMTAERTRTLTIPYSENALNGLYAVTLHASKDDVTPIICAVEVGSRFFTATDRYTVGQWEHTAPDADSEPNTAADEVTILLPRKTAEWLAKQTPKVLGIDALTAGAHSILIEDGAVSILENAGEETGRTIAVQRFEKISGNFPPVARLFPDESTLEANAGDTPTAVNLKPAVLEKFTKGAIRAGDRNEAMRFQLTTSGNPKKPGPVLVTFGSSRQFKGLLQPIYLLR
jgi:hypothetical protein